MTSSQIRPYLTAQFLSSLLLVLQLPTAIHARNSNSNSAIDYSIYGMSMQRDWLYNSNHVSMKYLGCVWGYVDADNGENLGCMPNESEDGTTSWYQMANCRRAQVAYGMYASSGSTNCKNKDFKESVSSYDETQLCHAPRLILTTVVLLFYIVCLPKRCGRIYVQLGIL
jgi:hypothetical protein